MELPALDLDSTYELSPLARTACHGLVKLATLIQQARVILSWIFRAAGLPHPRSR